MKSVWLVILVVGACALGLLAQSEDQPPIRDGILIHISHGSDNPHRALMALRMAEVMSEDHDVLVYFDITAVELVLKDAVDTQFKEFPSSRTQLQKLASRNVTLLACPSCLQAAGKSKTDLAPGVKIADKAQFTAFTKGRIVTLDY